MKFTIDTEKKEITVYSDFEFKDVFKILDALEESIIDYTFILRTEGQLETTPPSLPKDHYIYIDNRSTTPISNPVPCTFTV